MKITSLFRIVLLVAVATFGATAVRAQDLGAVKARIEQRLSAVDALKDRQVAGETNRGFLEARGSATADDQKVIADENGDRRTVYAALAAQTGATPDVVGRQRAQQLASLAKPGVWIQDGSGAWKQKG